MTADLTLTDALAEVQRLRDERDQAVRGRNEWRDDFKALAAAVVGDTGLSAMTVAAQARTFRPVAERAEAERDAALARVEKLREAIRKAANRLDWCAMQMDDEAMIQSTVWADEARATLDLTMEPLP